MKKFVFFLFVIIFLPLSRYEYITFLDALVALLVSLSGTSLLVALVLPCSAVLVRLDEGLLAIVVALSEVGASVVDGVEDLTVVGVLEEISSRLLTSTTINK